MRSDFKVFARMFDKDNNQFKRKTCFAFGVLILLIFSVYSNTLKSSWHLDDYPNIIENSKLHLKDLSPPSLYKTLFSHPWHLNEVYRPIVCLTFALNWYVGKDNVAGYHLVNLIIHFFTAFFLYLTILNLSKSVNIGNSGLYHYEFIALLAASLWAVNPIQTQAVTYIVQRMASMAAMFYILGIFFYVKGRISKVTWQQRLFFLGCALSYVLAIGSKENAVTLPVALMLAEIIFFQHIEISKIRQKIWIIATAAGVLFILTGILYFINADDLTILKGYKHRSFTLSERLMTEPRILIFYLTQLFYPMPHRLSIEHDITISTSFYEPWTTLPAIILVFLLIILGCFQIKKRPIVTFGILFFFLNHLIESSILPLELVFEHRNYLPSLFLFWPLAILLYRAADYYRQNNRFIFKSLVAFIVLLVLGFGISTYMRNMVWATERTLWEDTISKAPGRTRPVYNLAKYYFRVGNFGKALELFKQSLKFQGSKPQYSQALSLNAIAGIYYIQKDYEKVVELCRQALEISPGLEVARFNAALAQIKMGRWEKALESVNLLLERRRRHGGYLFLKGVILINQNRPEQALIYLRRALKLKPDDRKIMLSVGISLGLIEQYQQAEWFFKRAIENSPRDSQPYLYLIENGLKAGDRNKIEHYLDKLFAEFSVNAVISKLNGSFNDLFLIAPSVDLIAPVINNRLEEIADEISSVGSR